MSMIGEWWHGRSRREQILVGIMLLIAVPVITWFLVIAPANAWHDDARADYVAASDRYGRVKALANAGGDANVAAEPGFAGTLSDHVAATADQAGFALTSNNPSGPDRTSISIAQARSAAALTWIEMLRTDGVTIEALSITDNGEGGVALDLTLSTERS